MTQYGFKKSTSCESVGTAYNVSKYSSVSMSYSLKRFYLTELKCIQIKLSNLHSSTSTISVQICSDENGDNIILPDTAAAISRGLTTTNSGEAVIAVNCVLYSSIETWYIFYKLDSGSADVDDSILSITVN